jgi:ABC-2 type transport system permease protein
VAAARAIALRTLADGRIRAVSFGLFFAFYAVANVAGYRDAYPTPADRRAFALGFGADRAVRFLYGVPHNLVTVGGYVSWRVGGGGAMFAGVWGIVAAVRAFRGEEDSGRMELVLAAPLSRLQAYLSILAGLAVEAGLLWLVLAVGLAAPGLAAGQSAYLALALVATGAVFVGVGALASQVLPSRRLALMAASGLFVAALLARVVADTASGAGWLRWATPLGWAEEMRAFTGPRPAVVVLPAAATAGLLAAAVVIAVRRDLGTGLIETRDAAPADLRLLGSPTANALRGERATLTAWAAGVALFALIVGSLASSFNHTSIPASLRQQLHKLGASVVTPAGAVGLYFLFGALAFSLFCCAQVGAARREESEGRLETLFALPVGRRPWLAGRIALAAAGSVLLAVVAGVAAWAGAAGQGAGLSFGRVLEASFNCLPAALLFLGLATLAFTAWPRAGPGIGYALVGTAFVWQLVGAILSVPSWTLGISPFNHIGLVPAQPFRAGAAALMLAVAAAALALADWCFRRRDLTGA